MGAKRDFLNNLLSSDNVKEEIRKNLDTLLYVVPEVADMIGFEHRHPHHHLDVWEHTLCALSFAPNEFDVRLSLLFHDIGKPHSYQDLGEGVRHFNGHPEKSARITKEVLSRLGYPKDYIRFICGVVARHDTPLDRFEIIDTPKFAKTLFEVQKCDAWAHNPEHNAKRLKYIEYMTQMFKYMEQKDGTPSM